jgi:hypothetical protein
MKSKPLKEEKSDTAEKMSDVSSGAEYSGGLTPEQILQHYGKSESCDINNRRWLDVDWNNTEWAKFGNWTNSPPPK